jgi:hypothetical protein
MTALLEAAVRHDRAAAQASTLLRAGRAPASAPARTGLVDELSRRSVTCSASCAAS